MLNAKQFCDMLLETTLQNTIYMKGGFGRIITQDLLNQYKSLYPDWYNESRMEQYKKLIGKNYAGYDCIGLIKAQGWKDSNGNIVYCSNGVPDATERGLIDSCSNVSSDFSKIENGELLYMEGHCGVYVDGKVVECTTAGTGNVQITSLTFQKWTKHGKLPWVDYSTNDNKSNDVNLKDGDVIKLKSGAKYSNGATIPSWVFNMTLYYRGMASTNTVKFSTQKTGAITGIVSINDIEGQVAFTDYTKSVEQCPYNEPTAVLYKGCRQGNDVKWVQWYLVKTGFLAAKYDGVHDSVDGSWGNATDQAFNKFQTYYPNTGVYNQHNKRWEPDGRCGEASRKKLKSLL